MVADGDSDHPAVILPVLSPLIRLRLLSDELFHLFSLLSSLSLNFERIVNRS